MLSEYSFTIANVCRQTVCHFDVIKVNKYFYYEKIPIFASSINFKFLENANDNS